jgi:hypothetical protein
VVLAAQGVLAAILEPRTSATEHTADGTAQAVGGIT